MPPLRNAPSATLARLGSIGARLRGEVPALDAPAADTAALQRRLEQATAGLAPRPESRVVQVPPRPVAWHDTGCQLRQGESVTLLAEGAVHLLRALRLSMPAKAVLWYRIGNGRIAAAPAESVTFTAEEAGTLYLAALPPGSFADPTGTILPSPMHAHMSGGLAVAVVRWRGEARTGLEQAAAADEDLFGAALRRHRNPVKPPQGWHYLWRLGEGEIYEAARDTGAEICCHTSGDVGILQYPVDFRLTEDLRLAWSWRAEQLPSTRAEHVDLTHDYLSIAVEFDNGLDLTWMWSARLTPGTVFQCPLPWWKERETHWVLRSQSRDPLGEWLDEARPVAADYDTAIGGERPQRVVGVWLIANSLFQRREGLCRYRDIRLLGQDGEERLGVR